MSRPRHKWGGATRNRYVAAFSLIYSVAGPDGTKKLAIKPWARSGAAKKTTLGCGSYHRKKKQRSPRSFGSGTLTT